MEGTGIALGVAMLLAGIITLGASLTGNGQALCDRLGGTYTPGAADVCPGGSWANLFRSLKPPEQFDKK